MPAKPAKTAPAPRRASEAPAGSLRSGKEAQALLGAVQAAFPDPAQAGGSVAFAAFWDSGPPVLVRRRSGETVFASPACSDLLEALEAAKALPATDDLASIIDGLGRPYTESLVIDQAGESCFFLAWHALVTAPEDPGEESGEESGQKSGGETYLVSHYFPADSLGRRLGGLQISDDRWRDMTRVVNDIVWESDPEGVITYVSPRILHLLGYHPHEVIGQPWGRLAAEHDTLTARLLDAERRVPFRDLEVSLTDKAGRQRAFLIHGLPVFDRNSGRLTGFRGTAQDITDRLAHEAALHKAVEVADAASRAKSEFLANMSHELRTPLNAIIGFSEIMATEEFGPIGNERYREYVVSVLESGRHLLGLINQVLDVAKIEAGRLRLTEESVDPQALAMAALRVVGAGAKNRNITTSFALPDSSIRLWADEGKLRQILLNLLSNSVKFTEEGGSIEVLAKIDSDGAFLFQVRDTGIGIDPSQFATALTPFEQIDSHLTRRFDGTGLGLPLSKMLAEAHDGDLTLESVPGEGTTVTVRLPADRVRGI